MPRRLARGTAISLLLVFTMSGTAFAGEQKRSWKKRWVVSAVALTAASFLDFSSSVGRHEANPLMRGSDGRFNVGRAVAIKGGITAGLLTVEGLMMRHRQDASAEKSSTFVNGMAAAALAATAIRNHGVAK
jgi:hypothetical protein